VLWSHYADKHRELVALKPDVLVATSTPATAAFQDETPAIPIVFVGISDPVGAGFVANLAHPGGNLTGFINIEAGMGGKWLELLNEIAPGIQRAAIMFSPDTIAAQTNTSNLRPVLGKCRHGPPTRPHQLRRDFAQ
jgi:ABC-type uncharacterized transport system substrate-binding protein